ncbi:MAG: hypothetical protein IID41_01380 [Planctomycetes bacterium]|nr:hypothetical protein [Planctomycetota bacterium]
MQLDRAQTRTTWAAMGLLFAAIVTVDAFADPDMFHEMALIRQAVELGHLPLQDDFAYTPTLSLIVHHEWGTGAVLYCLTRFTGSAGILTLKYLLAAAIGLGVVICARKRGADVVVLGPLLPLAIFLGDIGITTVRAQMFTLGGLACLLFFLEADRAGRRRWIGPWLVLYVLWLNLHGGFVVGVGVLGLYTAEQFCRRAPTRHLLVTLLAMVALVAVNPMTLGAIIVINDTSRVRPRGVDSVYRKQRRLQSSDITSNPIYTLQVYLVFHTVNSSSASGSVYVSLHLRRVIAIPVKLHAIADLLIPYGREIRGANSEVRLGMEVVKFVERVKRVGSSGPGVRTVFVPGELSFELYESFFESWNHDEPVQQAVEP